MMHLLTILMPILIQLGSPQDTIVYYYPTPSVGAIPQLWYKASESAPDSTLLTGRIEFIDCQMQQRWVPADQGVEAGSYPTAVLRMYEDGGTYEWHPAPSEPEGHSPLKPSVDARKILRNGQLLIVRQGIVYTLNGTKQ